MSQLPLQLAERCQRWRAGRESYRPKGEVIDPRQYEVAPVPEKDAKAYVIATHYSSFNGIYLGRSTPDYLRLLDSGQILSKRTLQKIRSKERGWEYAVRQLVAAGATQPGPDLRAWLKVELPRVSKAVRHHGNHRFAWGFSKGSRRDLERLHDALPGHLLAYPKQPDPEPSATRRAA